MHVDIGGYTISYDPYYQKLWLNDPDDCEEEIRDDGLEIVQKLIKEVKKRLDKFEDSITQTRGNLANEIFDKPINIKGLE